MALTVLLLLTGLALVVFGADFLVEGASAIARKAGISEFVIGLTIVGFGTSCPELVVSVTGAISGNADIAIGNVVGSNIFNTLLILGITAVISPLAITKENRRRDIPVAIAATVLLLCCGMNHSFFGIGEADVIDRWEGILFLVLFAAYIFMCFKFNKSDEAGEAPKKEYRIPVAIILTLCGLAALIFGGDLFVDSATEIAHSLGVSDKFIAITLLAGGTSMPELATCIVAASKKKGQLALGNILGSNVFNILLILGTSAVITPLSCSGMTVIDFVALLVSSVLLFTAAYTGKKDKLDRFDGILLLACEAAYLTYLFITA